MPRYFFNMVDGPSKCLVLDPEGLDLLSPEEARREALELARDIEQHGVHQSKPTCKILVSDADGKEVLSVSLSEIDRRATWISRHFTRLVAKLRSKFRRQHVAWSLAATLAIVASAAASAWLVREAGTYEVASASQDGTVVAVRFASQTSVAEITRFLDAYKASLVGGPSPGGLYRLRIADTVLPRDEVTRIVSRISHEKIVEVAAPVY